MRDDVTLAGAAAVRPDMQRWYLDESRRWQADLLQAWQSEVERSWRADIRRSWQAELQRSWLAEMQRITAPMPDVQELQSALSELSRMDDVLESPEGWSDSPDDANSELASFDQVRAQVLLFMFVLWVRVTPYLSPKDMAEFARWWSEFVAALLSGA